MDRNGETNARKEERTEGDHLESGGAGRSHVIQSPGHPVRFKHARQRCYGRVPIAIDRGREERVRGAHRKGRRC